LQSSSDVSDTLQAALQASGLDQVKVLREAIKRKTIEQRRRLHQQAIAA
jgi:uncharacterized protein (UPF0335 family)